MSKQSDGLNAYYARTTPEERRLRGLRSGLNRMQNLDREKGTTSVKRQQKMEDMREAINELEIAIKSNKSVPDGFIPQTDDQILKASSSKPVMIKSKHECFDTTPITPETIFWAHACWLIEKMGRSIGGVPSFEGGMMLSAKCPRFRVANTTNDLSIDYLIRQHHAMNINNQKLFIPTIGARFVRYIELLLELEVALTRTESLMKQTDNMVEEFKKESEKVAD